MTKRGLKLKDILKKGASIKVEKLEETPEVRKLINQTIAEQKKILSLKDQPFKNLIITI